MREVKHGTSVSHGKSVAIVAGSLVISFTKED
jgi:hypothetical protein